MNLAIHSPTEPPCPIGNPPGRLMMLRTDIIRDHGFQLDTPLAECFRKQGFRPAVTARVRHRHLSLLNVFDHTGLLHRPIVINSLQHIRNTDHASKCSQYRHVFSKSEYFCS